MTKPLFYSPEVTGDATDQLVTLDADASGHAIRSQRLTTGEAVLVSDGFGTMGHGTIEVADPKHTKVRIGTVTVEPQPETRINLVQALAKSDRDLLAAEMATEIGVDAVTPWQAQRSIVRMRAEREAKTMAKWQAKLHAAAQQSRRAFIPQLHQLVEADRLAQLHDPAQGHHLIVLHEDGDDTIEGVAGSLTNVDTIHLAVGPEGGVSPDEVQAVTAAGGAVVKIGSNVMRASTAGPVAIALVNQVFDRW